MKDKEIPFPESMPRLTRNCDSVMKGTASLLGHPSYGSLDVSSVGALALLVTSTSYVGAPVTTGNLPP